jgi:hypothetical protein
MQEGDGAAASVPIVEKLRKGLEGYEPLWNEY